jgi:hypothetical protein
MKPLPQWISPSAQLTLWAAHKEVEAELGGKGLDFLIKNTGILNKYLWEAVDAAQTILIDSPPEDFRDAFNVDIVGVQVVTVTFPSAVEESDEKNYRQYLIVPCKSRIQRQPIQEFRLPCILSEQNGSQLPRQRLCTGVCRGGL